MVHRSGLRLGVIHSGTLVEERLLTTRSISVGSTARDHLILPSGVVPRRWRLFERQKGGYHLRLSGAMQAQIAGAPQVHDLPVSGRPRRLSLPPGSRGRITLGEVVILFQVVTPPAGPPPRLPRALRRSPARELDRSLAAVAVLSVAAHLAMVLYLRSVDWPRQPDPEEVPDVFVRQVLHRPAPPRPVALPTAAPPSSATSRPPASHPPATPRHPASREEERSRILARASHQGLLAVLSALGPSGSVRDLLRDGHLDREQEQAMREIGGLTVAQEGGSLPLGRGAGSGHVADVSGLQARSQIAAADVGPRSTERRVAVVRSELPALDEPMTGFDPQLIARTIRAHLVDVRSCYERALKRHPTIAGRLVLRFTLTPAGTVAAIDLDEDTLGEPEVSDCVRHALGAWRFPAPPRRVEVTFPFVFQPTS